MLYVAQVSFCPPGAKPFCHSASGSAVKHSAFLCPPGHAADAIHVRIRGHVPKVLGNSEVNRLLAVAEGFQAPVICGICWLACLSRSVSTFAAKPAERFTLP